MFIYLSICFSEVVAEVVAEALRRIAETAFAPGKMTDKVLRRFAETTNPRKN